MVVFCGWLSGCLVNVDVVGFIFDVLMVVLFESDLLGGI